MTPEQSRYIEGNSDCSLWLSSAGWELRTADWVKQIGHVSVEEAASNLHAVQVHAMSKRRWVA